MTRKEAIDCMMEHIEYPQSICTKCKYRYATQPCEMRTAFKMAINALEESSVIDRVLEIIRSHTVSGYGNMGEVANVHIRDAHGMIDEISALKGGENNGDYRET